MISHEVPAVIEKINLVGIAHWGELRSLAEAIVIAEREMAEAEAAMSITRMAEASLALDKAQATMDKAMHLMRLYRA